MALYRAKRKPQRGRRRNAVQLRPIYRYVPWMRVDQNRLKRIGPSQPAAYYPYPSFRIIGAMVDIGLGPTTGFRILRRIVRLRSPRRVQTDAYHRPYVLN